MACPRRSRLHAHELERRDTPAVLSYIATDGIASEIRIALDTDGRKVLVFNNDVEVANEWLDKTDSVVITAVAGEGDSLVVDYLRGEFLTVPPIPITFNGGGAKAEVTLDGGTGTVA